jgi:hypothetical protein
MFRHQPNLAVIASFAAAAALMLSVTAVCTAEEIAKAKSDAVEQDPTKALTTPTLPSANTAAREEIKDEEAARKLKQRAGENARGQALVLGMALKEAETGRAQVVEVAPTSPAFDAGVKEGDEIISFHGFAADSYRKWIDGMRRITTESPDGTMMSLVVLRNGERTALRIRNPITVQRTTGPRPLAQPTQVTPPTPGVVPVPVGPGAVPAGGNSIAVGNAGPFGAFFGGDTEAVNERAIAHIHKLSSPPTAGKVPVADPGTTDAGAGAAPANGGMRIGMAGFRDDPSGMVVMVDVGALPAGNYAVGISDPSILGATSDTAPANPNVNPGSNKQTDPPLVPLPAPDAAPGNAKQPAGAAPALPAPGGNQPQGSLLPGRRGQIPRTVLAQVAETAPAAQNATTIPPSGRATPSTIPPSGRVTPSTIPPSGRVTPSTIPPSGKVNPSSTTPTGQSAVNNAQRAQLGQGNVAAGSTMTDIGVLTVDQSGTGRMQQTVEGVQVRNVVGQAIVIFSQGGTQQTTVPANLSGTAGASTTQGVTDTTSARGSQNVVDGQQGAAARQQAAGQVGAGTRTPVAAGIIRLISDRRPPTEGTNTAVAPPGTTPAGQNPVR